MPFDSEQLVDVKVLEKTTDGLEVAILPHNIPAFLPISHLSDHVANGPLLHHWLQAGDTLHRVLCLSQGEKHIVSLTDIWGSGRPWAPGWEILNSSKGRKINYLSLKILCKTKLMTRPVLGKQEQAQEVFPGAECG